MFRGKDFADLNARSLGRYVRWLEVERGLLPETIKSYRHELLALIGRYGSSDIEELGTAELREYVHERGGKAPTVARRLAILRSYYRYLVFIDRRADDPTMRMARPKVRRGLPKPVDRPEETILKLDATAQLVAIFLRETGLRISEAAAINVELPAPAILRVTGKGDKTRKVPLSKEAQAALNWLGGRMPYSKRTIQRRMKDVDVTPHRWRHTFASELADEDVDGGVIQDLMGHESFDTTRVYLRNKDRRLREAIDRRSQRTALPPIEEGEVA